MNPLRVLTLIIALWLVGVACLGSTLLIGAVIVLPGICTLLVCIRQARRAKWGDLKAWACLSLAPLAFLADLSLASMHLQEFTGRGSDCDAMAQDCSPHPLQGLAHAASLVAFTAAAILTIWLIRKVHRAPAETENAVWP